MNHNLEALHATVTKWRQRNQERHGGVVLVWQGEVYGWKNCLRDAVHERPGAYAIDEYGHVFIAEGGDDQNGARCWVVVGPTSLLK
ncbi:antirestriction protein ArdR [Pseudomonas sp. ITA]|uniref:antirestriction protein ArdR n=1 Tax=Pseudomonas sp. ITA TaxID=2825841 RepID=UPI00249885DE|nr:antirestriction protein ArdR [Pseudomonas sp. ITA]MDI2145036.1 antirestriction protein ArdR [Pseudomonas sp. ITA]